MYVNHIRVYTSKCQNIDVFYIAYLGWKTANQITTISKKSPRKTLRKTIEGVTSVFKWILPDKKKKVFDIICFN